MRNILSIHAAQTPKKRKPQTHGKEEKEPFLIQSVILFASGILRLEPPVNQLFTMPAKVILLYQSY